MAETLLLKPMEMLLERLIDKAMSIGRHHILPTETICGEIGFLREILPQVRDLVLNVTDHDDVPSSTRAFLGALRDFVYDAEDILDRFDTEISRRRWEENSRKQPKGAPFLSDDMHWLPLLLQWKIAKKVKGLYEKLRKIQDVRKMRDDLFKFLVDSGLHLTINDSSIELFSGNKLISDEVLTRDFHMVGREDVKGRIIERLLKVTCRPESEAGISCGDSNMCPDCACRPLILLITGMAGLGKTTLAQDIFRDPQIVEHFKSFIKWVSVEDEELDPDKMMNKIMGSKVPLNDRDVVRRELEGKKFLIVLDDVRKGEKLRESWNKLRELLSYGASGSRVIITSREEDVKVELIGHVKMEVERLAALEDEECLQIFERCAFPVLGEPASDELRAIGRQIVYEKVKGVPLAAMIIGSSLCTVREERQWQNVLQLINHNDVHSAIMWSYRRLPSPLKQCFVHLSLFPKDNKLDRTRIIRMWIAHGYVVQTNDGSCNLEDIAEQYFDYLVKVRLIQFVDRDSYCLHDLVHNFLTSAYTSSLYSIDSRKLTEEIQEPMVIQHLNVRCCSSLQKNYSNASKLRMLITEDHASDVVNKLSSARLKTVRVMSCFVNGDGGVHLQKLTRSMVHLRYLDLSGSYMQCLPESLCSLYNLQTLLLSFFLRQFPKTMWKLVNLRHLSKETGEMPIIERIEELTSLQTISGIQLSNGNRVREMRVLGSLSQPGRSLWISGLGLVRNSNDALHARLEEKKHIERLFLNMSTSDFLIEPMGHNEETLCKEVLDNLKPHHDLQQLSIRNYYGRGLPTWLEDSYLCNLKSLTLYKISSSLEKMPPLGLLPKLETIWMFLCDVKQIGNEIYGGSIEAVFPSLKQIWLEKNLQLEEWEELKSADKCLIKSYFPSLKEINIQQCLNLRCLPPVPTSLEKLEIIQSGITALPKVWGQDDSTANTYPLPNLKHLKVKDCSELVYIDLHGMPSIGFLRLRGMQNLKKLVFCNLPFLRDLKIRDCPILTVIDGLRGLTALDGMLWFRNVSRGFKVEKDDINILQNLKNLYADSWEILRAVDPHSIRELQLNFYGYKQDLYCDISCEEYQWLKSWWGNLQSIQEITIPGATREECPPWILQIENIHPHIQIRFW